MFQPTIPSPCTFMSPNNPSGGPGTWERLRAKGSGRWGRVGTTTLQANFSAAVVSVCRWEGLRDNSLGRSY